jgi:hypothetical protein
MASSRSGAFGRLSALDFQWDQSQRDVEPVPRRRRSSRYGHDRRRLDPHDHDRLCKSNAYTNGDGNCYTNSDSHSYCDGNSYSNSPAKEYTDAKTASHTSAATIEIFAKRKFPVLG